MWLQAASELLQMAAVHISDEFPMCHQRVFEAVNRCQLEKEAPSHKHIHLVAGIHVPCRGACMPFCWSKRLLLGSFHWPAFMYMDSGYDSDYDSYDKVLSCMFKSVTKITTAILDTESMSKGELRKKGNTIIHCHTKNLTSCA